MAATYKYCRNCGSDKNGTSVLRCDKCKFLFCSNCSIYKKGIITSSFCCPRCDYNENTTIGEIENGDDSYDGDSDSSSTPSSPQQTKATSVSLGVFLIAFGGYVFIYNGLKH